MTGTPQAESVGPVARRGHATGNSPKGANGHDNHNVRCPSEKAVLVDVSHL